MTYLPLGEWYPKNHERLNLWLGEIAARVKGGEKPIAVFDWDNTCIFRDIGDATLRRQADKLELKLTPEELAECVPEEISGVTSISGVSLAALRADLLEAYAELYPAAGLGRAAHQDFRCKLVWLYEALGRDARIGHAFGYRWVTRLAAGMSEREVRELAQRVVVEATQEPLGKQTWTSARAGRSGVTSVDVDTGLRAHPEIRDLITAMKRVGIDVYVVSASLQALVQGASAALDYGLARENIYGMRLAERAGRYTMEQAPSYFVPYREGKAKLIAALLPSAPVLVAGDANTDYEMLVGFPETEVRLVLNRNASGDIAKLYPLAHKDHGKVPGKGRVVTLLQGRNERTGCFHPETHTI